MRTSFIYILFICYLFFGCKGSDTASSKPTKDNPEAFLSAEKVDQAKSQGYDLALKYSTTIPLCNLTQVLPPEGAFYNLFGVDSSDHGHPNREDSEVKYLKLGGENQIILNGNVSVSSMKYEIEDEFGEGSYFIHATVSKVGGGEDTLRSSSIRFIEKSAPESEYQNVHGGFYITSFKKEVQCDRGNGISQIETRVKTYLVQWLR